MNDIKNNSSYVINTEAIEKIIKASGKKSDVDKRGKYSEKGGHNGDYSRHGKAVFKSYPA